MSSLISPRLWRTMLLKQSDGPVTVSRSRNGAPAHRNGERRPEDELLAACSRVEMEPMVSERIKSLVAGGLDWDYLLRMAPYHGVLPLLYWNLSRACPDDIPEAVREKLKTEFDSTTRRNLHLTAEPPVLMVRQGKGRKDRLVPIHGELRVALSNHIRYKRLSASPLVSVNTSTAWR